MRINQHARLPHGLGVVVAPHTPGAQRHNIAPGEMVTVKEVAHNQKTGVLEKVRVVADDRSRGMASPSGWWVLPEVLEFIEVLECREVLKPTQE